MSILLFGLPCWSITIQNVCIHYAGVNKIPDDVLPYFDWEVANSIFMCLWSWQSTPCFVADLLWSLTTQSPVCVNNDLNLYWQDLQFYCLSQQWPPSLSCHPDMICKHHSSFYQVYKYLMEDTSYSLILSHCSMFYKPASPSKTG